MNTKEISHIRHSVEFIDKWRNLLIDIYSYQKYMEYMVVPSIFFKKTLSYLPLLNYSDRLSNDIDDLLELGKDNNYQIRALNPDYSEFIDGDTVNMRVDISSFDLDYISKEIFSSRKCGNQIRKAEKNGLVSISGISDELINDFYMLYKQNMLKHGTPMLGMSLFEKIARHVECDFVVTYSGAIPVSSVLVVYDKDIVLALWAGVDSKYMKLCPNHSMYWKVIELGVNKKKLIFDFGRSGYNSATYLFKQQWGAKPIKIDIIKPYEDDVYEKYTLASRLWKLLPTFASSLLGPKLCKFLDDL
jgi:hypothetical protein